MLRSNASDVTLRDVFGILYAHKGKVLLTFICCVGAAAAYTVWTPRTYRSESKLFLRLGRENVALDPTAALGQAAPTAIPLTREAELNSVLEVLLSRTLIERLVDRLGPQAVLGDQRPLSASGALVAGFSDAATPVPSEPSAEPWYAKLSPFSKLDDRERAILSLFSMITAETVKKSNVIVVRCDADRSDKAQLIVETLVDLYVEEHVRSNRTPGAHRFLAEQAKRLHGEVTRAEDSLRKLKDETGLAAPEEQRKHLVDRLAKLEDDLGQTTASMDSLRAEVSELEKTLAAIPKTQVSGETKGFSNEALDNMRGQLFALQLQEKNLLAKYQADHIDVIRIRQQIETAKAELTREEKARTQTTTGLNPVYSLAESSLVQKRPTLAALAAKDRALRTQIADARRGLGIIDENIMQIARLQRELDLHDASYRRYAGNLEQAELDEMMQKERISNISIVQPATLEPKSIKPKPAMNLAAGAIIGLFGGCGWAFAAHILRPKGAGPRDSAAAAFEPEINPALRSKTRSPMARAGT